MNTYLLFLNGLFDSQESLEEFTTEFIQNTKKNIRSHKFIIENNFNAIVIFDTELDDYELSELIKNNTDSDIIRFYFLFNRESILIANVPQEISQLIFKELPKDSSLEINFIPDEDEEEDEEDYFVDDGEPIKNEEDNSIDDILDKIKKHGIESLTEIEKKFLDDFNN